MEGSQSETKEEEGEKKKNEVINNNTLKGKSCKGCLYYSSIRKSNSQNPVCVGVTRTLQQVPDYIVGESEMEASKDGRNLTDFKYACLGYSVHLDKKSSSADPKEKQAELPVCVGIEFLVDKRPVTADHVPAHNKEDGHTSPQPRPYKPSYSMGEEFLGKFSRNASLVAAGVGRNMQRVGRHIKENLDDALYPYRRRPK
ncbi:Altered inheritance of mitochondria protein [Thalictrum thalictroides]|uniref:Altered inheritance of mitochondria protein n=1 Tax=Thalictrum thalictroides TaxID=46969 RepID=A0A7J6VK24_THATH|nr:Altered inheritance of mitochondria protein [Thalictrum thalictroides]